MTRCGGCSAAILVLVAGISVSLGCAATRPEAKQEAAPTAPLAEAGRNAEAVPPAAAVAQERAVDEGGPVAHRFVAYYFHRTLRCHGCLWIEAQAKRVVEEAFADELRSGRISWQATNIDLDENRHFEKDFSLESSTLVLADLVEGQTVRWKALSGVWESVEKQPEFDEYVADEISAWLGK